MKPGEWDIRRVGFLETKGATAENLEKAMKTLPGIEWWIFERKDVSH